LLPLLGFFLFLLEAKLGDAVTFIFLLLLLLRTRWWQ
jgi:hypothetical protein